MDVFPYIFEGSDIPQHGTFPNIFEGHGGPQTLSALKLKIFLTVLGRIFLNDF